MTEISVDMKTRIEVMIKNFKHLNDNSIESSEFKISNNIWFVEVCPRIMKDNVEYVNVCLRSLCL